MLIFIVLDEVHFPQTMIYASVDQFDTKNTSRQSQAITNNNLNADLTHWSLGGLNGFSDLEFSIKYYESKPEASLLN